ncbi:hypothetical protein [Staphylococcus sp. 11262D007BW]
MNYLVELIRGDKLDTHFNGVEVEGVMEHDYTIEDVRKELENCK